jgi:superfamily II helicase
MISSNLRKKHPLDLAISLETFRNVYLSDRLIAEIERSSRRRIATRLFAGSVLDLMNAKSHRRRRRIEPWVLNIIAKWSMDFFQCGHNESPFCECGTQAVSRKITELRMEGFTPKMIATEFQDQYELNIYPGDIIGWLDSLVHGLKAIQRIAEVAVDPEIVALSQETMEVIQYVKATVGFQVPQAEMGVVRDRRRRPRNYRSGRSNPRSRSPRRGKK